MQEKNNLGLRGLHIRQFYDPSHDGSDVLNEFYIPCLSSSIIYDRCSAYFSSAVLKSFSKGLINFFKKNGHARFIFSCHIDADEMKIIMDAYKTKMDDLSVELCNLDNDYEIANLAYLIQHNLVEVKIAFMLKNKAALMHIKSGLFEDEFGNQIYFDGSGNETEAGILMNAEIFNVFNNFEGNNFYLTNGINRFEQIWNNTYSPETIRTEFPKGKLFEKLISFSKNRLFNSAKEFYEYKNCVLIDIDKSSQSIIFFDYTKEKKLKVPMILKSQFSNYWTELSADNYVIKKLNAHIIKDIVIKRLENYGIEYVLSIGAELYLEEHDLELDKRQKLGLAIKQNINQKTWMPQFERFKYVVNCEMIARLKEKQTINAFYHYCMKSSADFSVPGTGKTYISYGLFAYLLSTIGKEQQVNHLVVFGPLNCFRAWKDEAKAIFGDKRKFTIFDVTEHHNDFNKVITRDKFDIYLINYDFISEKRLETISKNIINTKALIVFDEIHKLKSIVGTRANLFIKLFESCTNKPVFKLALTGTPIPNSFTDIYNYLKLLYSSDLEGVFSHLSINRLKQADSNFLIAKNISDTLQSIFVRTTKKDLLVPEANPNDIDSLSVLPTENERILYEYIWKTYKEPLVKFIRLIQASSNPGLLLKDLDLTEISMLYENEENMMNISNTEEIKSKLLEQKELIESIGIASKTAITINKIESLVKNNEKVIVWCLFIDTIDKVAHELKKRGIKLVTVSGRDATHTREEKIDTFKFGDAAVLITNPNTLAESISLHKVCHNAIYLEFGFNLTYLLQSKDRIHRVGLEEGTKTNYYFAISKKYNQHGPIDEYIYDKLAIKDERMKNVIESNDLKFIPDKDDIKDILDIIDKL